MPDYQNLIERDSRGISLTAVLDAFNETSTWYDFILRLCFETHGVQVITLFAALAFLTYRLSGSPLDVSLEEKQCEREELWAAHNERFKPRKHPKWKSPAGVGVMSWNGTGSGAGIRRSAALGDKRVLGVHPASREEALVADYRAPEDFTNTMAIKGGGGGGGGGKSSLAADALSQESHSAEQARLAATLLRPSISYRSVPSELARVCVVGDPSKATVSVVTVHDTCTTYRNGMLQMSTECVSQMAYQASRVKSKMANVPVPVFYHISMPGHDVVEEGGGEGLGEIPESDWAMDKLAGMVNRVVRELGVEGRYIFMGEGAGANVVTRAACEEKQRQIDDYNSLRSQRQVRTGGMLMGLVLLQVDFDGPTVGDNLSGYLGSCLMRRGYRGLASARFGVPEAVSGHPGFEGDFGMMHEGCVASYASSYLSTDRRTSLEVRRTRALGGMANLVLFAEGSAKAREGAVRAVEQLDRARGSGGVGVQLRTYIGEYSAGGGATLKDEQGRRNVVQALKLFIEAA